MASPASRRYRPRNCTRMTPPSAMTPPARARGVGTSPSQSQALEADLGLPLFDRLGRRVALTEAGRRLLPYAERLLALADEARGAVGADDEPGGLLRIGAPETLCTYRLPALLARFRAEHPRVQLSVQPLADLELCRRVGEGTIDVAFIFDEPPTGSGLLTEPLVTEQALVLAAPEHPLAGRDSVAVADLGGQPLLLTEPGCSYRTRFLRALTTAGLPPAPTTEFGSVEAIKQCVMAGLGITVLPAVAVATEVADRRLVALPWDGPDLRFPTQLALHREKWHSPALRAFLDTARRLLRTPDKRPE